MPTDDDHRAFADRAITRIAELLDCSMDDLSSGDGSGPADIEGATELLGLWMQIEEAGDRAKLLDFARKLAGS